MDSSLTDQQQDKYRSYLHGEGEKNTKWKLGAPPNYDTVNKLFEEGQTKVFFSSVFLYLSARCTYYTYIVYLICLMTDMASCITRREGPEPCEDMGNGNFQ